MISKDTYTRIGRASEIANPRERRIYRALEIFPGVLAWGFLGALVVLSFFVPTEVAIFVIAFDVYWFVKVVYFSFHLRSTHRRMKQNIAADWTTRLRSEFPGRYREYRHLVVLPMYKESLEVVSSTFRALATSDYDLKTLMVVLSVEGAGGEEAQEVARKMSEEYGDTFLKLFVTTHPAGIPGELAGKGSNQAWGTRRFKEAVIDPEGIPYEKIIVSVLDIDTNVLPGYFARLTHAYLSHPRPHRASFQPIPFFTNNIWEAPSLARVLAFSSTFWHMMQQERPERQATFSSHSMSFQALHEIGFWQTNIVSEDSRIFWQCLLYFDGDYEVVSLYYPVSMDANVAPTFWGTMISQYKQQRRWAWGTENLSYILYGFLKNKKISFKKKLAHAFHKTEGYHSWATNSIVVFMMGWLPVIVGGAVFNTTLLSYNLPRITRWLVSLAMVGIVTSIVISINLMPPRPPEYGRHKYFMLVMQWILLPPLLIFFGSVPALDAQTRLMLGKYMGFWLTPKHRKGIQK
jgi:cellulose synthase/poly-beta-1,6-N-acetylglucosamine synthase-like glycosyltransferase